MRKKVAAKLIDLLDMTIIQPVKGPYLGQLYTEAVRRYLFMHGQEAS